MEEKIRVIQTLVNTYHLHTEGFVALLQSTARKELERVHVLQQDKNNQQEQSTRTINKTKKKKNQPKSVFKVSVYNFHQMITPKIIDSKK